MTSKQLSSPCRRKPRGQAKPSIELPSLYLELKSRVEPTWDNPEPDDYIVGLDGDVMVSGREEEDDVRVGYISAFNVHLGQAYDDGVPWFDVLDARSADMALYTDLIDLEESCYTEWVESTFEPFGSDLLILDRIRIEPEHRGHGYGLYAAELMISGFGPSTGLIACVPAPYELLKNAPIRTNNGGVRINRQHAIPGWEAAEAKLRKHWFTTRFSAAPGLRCLRPVPKRPKTLHGNGRSKIFRR